MDFIVSINKPQMIQAIAYSFSRVNPDMQLKSIIREVDDIIEDVRKSYDNTTLDTDNYENMLDDIAFAIRTRIYKWHIYPDCNVEVDKDKIWFVYPDIHSIWSGVLVVVKPKAHVVVNIVPLLKGNKNVLLT